MHPGYTHPNLKEQLDLVLPLLGRALIDEDRVSSLRALASSLAPVSRGGFECWLGGSHRSRVDLHQSIYPTDSELVLLRNKIAANDFTAAPSIRSGWTHLHDFLTAWSRPSSPLHSCIPEIWLEYDNDKDSPALLPPSIFFALSHQAQAFPETYTKLIAPLLARLLGSNWSLCKDNLYRCFAYCPPGAFVSHIGIMLSKNTRVLRVNIKHLAQDALIPYLQRLGRQRETDRLKALLTELSAFFSAITICLDVGPTLHPRIGFECMILGQPPDRSRWRDFLDHSIARGLCRPQEKEALSDWPGQTCPTNAGTPWPDRLIAASLLQPKTHFTVINRRMNHLKVVWHPHHPLLIKAYLLWTHVLMIAGSNRT